MNRSTAIGLGALLLTAAALVRIVDLEHNPPGFWQDEVSTGADALSLWRTGKDRAGATLPIIARSFGDYPLALYRYLDAPIVGILGPSIRGERIVAAVAGTLLVLGLGFLLAQIFGRAIAMAAMLSAVFCPTGIHFSRYGSEAILLPTTLVWGWALVEHGLRRGARGRGWLASGAFVLGLSAYTYHAVKVILPLWIAGFLLLVWPCIVRLWQSGNRRKVLVPIITFAIVVLPSVWVAFTPEGRARGDTVLAWRHASGLPLFRTVLGNYLSYFDPGMLFVRGGPAIAQSMPGLGVFNLIDLPLVLVGAVALVRGNVSRGRRDEIEGAEGGFAPERAGGGGARGDVPGSGEDPRRLARFLGWWFLIGPLPGGLAIDADNIGRIIGWLPVMPMVSGIGLVVVLRWGSSKARSLCAALALLLGIAWAATAGLVLWTTFRAYPRISQDAWQFEISGALRCARTHRQSGERIVVSTKFHLGEVFASFLFGDLEDPDRERRVWSLGDPAKVERGTLYAFPAQAPLPQGREVCRITRSGSTEPVSSVYAAALDAGDRAAPAPNAHEPPTPASAPAGHGLAPPLVSEPHRLALPPPPLVPALDAKKSSAAPDRRGPREE